MNYQDFQDNPNKYKSFRTAQVNGGVLTHNGENDIEDGTIVGVRFLEMKHNPVYQREEPLYTITLQNGIVHPCNLFGSSLKNFVL